MEDAMSTNLPIMGDTDGSLGKPLLGEDRLVHHSSFDDGDRSLFTSTGSDTSDLGLSTSGGDTGKGLGINHGLPSVLYNSPVAAALSLTVTLATCGVAAIIDHRNSYFGGIAVPVPSDFGNQLSTAIWVAYSAGMVVAGVMLGLTWHGWSVFVEYLFGRHTNQTHKLVGCCTNLARSLLQPV